MNVAFLARSIVTAIAAGQGIAPVFIDLNRTHATNSLWPGHARFHLVQQVFTLLPLSIIEVALIWCPGPALAQRFYLAALLTATPLAGFLVATLARSGYRGALYDPNGIQPLRIHIGEREIAVEINIVLITAASLLLIAAVILFRMI